MHTTFSKRLALSFSSVFLASLMLTPIAEARPGKGGGGGGHHAAGASHHAAPSHANRDARSNNVRNTSVNNVNSNRNVNVNKNVNVNVDNDRHGGCCHNGWDDDYHPVATAAAVTATVAVTSAVIGSITRSVPPGCVPVNVGGATYQQCGNTWYQPQYVSGQTQYVVVSPPQ